MLSVVVSMHNVKEYVEERIASILNQTYTNLELVLGINGPTDGPDQICREYAQKDDRIKLLEIEEKHGVLRAWKAGILAAIGERLTFADDYIDVDLFQRLMDEAGNFDLICFIAIMAHMTI